MNKQYIFCISFLILIVALSVGAAQNSETGTGKLESLNNIHILNTEQIDKLLVKPSCIKPIRDNERWKNIFKISKRRRTFLPTGCTKTFDEKRI